MKGYRSGRVTTGAAGTLTSTTPESGDKILTKPKLPEGSKCYKAHHAPLNLATPNGRVVSFVNGFFVTADKDLISYLSTQVGKTCELC